jgi:hypothetical protein
MIVPEELVLGLLLATSSFFLALALTAYRRSGVRALAWISGALAAHVAVTLFLVVALLGSDSMDDALRLYLVVADALALAVILTLGVVGGKRGG